jgi:hypothetical protein
MPHQYRHERGLKLDLILDWRSERDNPSLHQTLGGVGHNSIQVESKIRSQQA